MAGEFVNRSEFAALRGCAKSYVTKLGHQGRLVLDPTGKLIDVAATAAMLERTDDPARGGDRAKKYQMAHAQATALGMLPRPGLASAAPEPRPGAAVDGGGSGDTPAYRNAATRERVAKARLAELDLAEKAGNLVRRAEVEAAVFSLARQAQDALDAIADRLSTQLAAESDPARVHKLLSDDVRRVMQQIADARPLPALTAEQLAAAVEPAEELA